MIGFNMFDSTTDDSKYVGPIFNTSLSDIGRGNFTTQGKSQSSIYNPPPLELYTQLSQKVYYALFFGLHTCQVLLIFLIDVLKNGSKCGSLWSKMINAVLKSHFPFPQDDWDVGFGNCLDHIKRKQAAQREFLITSAVDLIFNLTLLFPMAILCK